MLMDEILIERAKIKEFLDTIVQAHKRYLFDIQDPQTLDKLRKDIRICLYDICKLNAMLTSNEGDGSIKQEIDRLAKQARKLEKLDQREFSIEASLQEWHFEKQDEDQDAVEDNVETETFSFQTRYRHFLNQYLSRVGISTTSVVNGNEPLANSEKEIDATVDKNSTIQNVSMLRTSQTQVQREMSQLESLLSAFKKDEKFIKQELQRRQNEIDSVVVALSSNLSNVHRSQDKLLAKLGIADDFDRGDSSLLSRFNKIDLEKSSHQRADQLSYAKEYLAARQDVLNANLKMCKEDLSFAESTRNIWDDSLNKINSLERLLKNMLMENSNTPPQILSQEIYKVVTELQETLSSTASDILDSCLGNEIEILKRANEELISRSSETPSSKPQKELGGSLSITGSSPPKIGLNRENITYLNGSSLQPGTSIVNLDKMQKRE
ncbi:LANO_0G12816g1_1 [Lachancea nothofagi CBS 11611]|uniref:LANO_0G12816g1_1 n=1 Tax=Lachancea nothofagi CBS 11611 TaxID=1266666 RepID=A0A1G4KJU2_9SACH|nr:LANO_0G12816g1_1 [Lachancea nothofagi CBS 11611]